jgi:putative ABC transport system permease protein
VIGEASQIVALGLGAGAVAALLVSRSAESLLFGLEANDTATLAGAAAVMAIVGLGATLTPALRAARIPPVKALRES